MRKFIAYIFVFIFFISATPVREIGKLLAKGQLTEEVQSDDSTTGDDDQGDDDSDIFKVKQSFEFIVSTEPIEQNVSYVVEETNTKYAIPFELSFNHQHYKQIQSPPPDFC